MQELTHYTDSFIDLFSPSFTLTEMFGHIILSNPKTIIHCMIVGDLKRADLPLLFGVFSKDLAL